MCLRAAIRRPLRSKRAITSPVRPRSNASGLTRIRVRDTGQLRSELRSSVCSEPGPSEEEAGARSESERDCLVRREELRSPVRSRDFEDDALAGLALGA